MIMRQRLGIMLGVVWKNHIPKHLRLQKKNMTYYKAMKLDIYIIMIHFDVSKLKSCTTKC